MSQTDPMNSSSEVTIIDGHVHMRNAFDVSIMLSASLLNIDRLAAGAAKVHGVLMLAESAGEEAFARLASHDQPIGRWRFNGTDEPCVIEAERDDGRLLSLVNGRQWTCDDKLEVLTLGSDARLTDGMPFAECIGAGLEAGAMVVVPWGFGKWTGARRDRVLEAIDRFGADLVLGDSAARPGRSRDTVLETGALHGLPVLPGTDPLPIPPHLRRAGRYGLCIDAAPPRNRRWDWLDSQIRSSPPVGQTIGSRDGVIGALATQVRLRFG